MDSELKLAQEKRIRLMSEFRKTNPAREMIVCLSDIGSQRWRGMVVSPTGTRDGSKIDVEVVADSPAFPRWFVGRVGPMALSYYKAMGGSVLTTVSKPPQKHVAAYSAEEMFGAIDMSVFNPKPAAQLAAQPVK